MKVAAHTPGTSAGFLRTKRAWPLSVSQRTELPPWGPAGIVLLQPCLMGWLVRELLYEDVGVAETFKATTALPFPLNTYWSPIPFLRAPSFYPLDPPQALIFAAAPLTFEALAPSLCQRCPVTLRCEPGQQGPVLPYTHVLMFTVCGKRQLAKPKATREDQEGKTGKLGLLKN